MVFDVGVQDAAQPALIPDDDVIEAFAANGSDQPFGIRVGVSSRLHHLRTVRHKSFGLPIPFIHCVAGRFD
ncbi:MAG: hypothetical protein DMG02_00690 [Acidobacteria bacterium]|nr:MAG: hypothetical protein DMG02_00690 [Acidobacteriota bacterium]PYR04237.1 MAG: hypothetical protein DMF99_32305 [Acidobacteriota bacterium]